MNYFMVSNKYVIYNLMRLDLSILETLNEWTLFGHFRENLNLGW